MCGKGVNAVNAYLQIIIVNDVTFIYQSIPYLPPDLISLQVTGEDTGTTRKIAYCKSPGPRTPGIIYIPGFMSDKKGIKAVSLYKFCQKHGFPYVR